MPMTPPVFLISLRDLPAPGGILPTVALSRGLNIAARTYSAPLVLDFTLVYFSAGAPVTVKASVPISATTEGKDLDAQTIMVSATINTLDDGTPVPPVIAKSPVTASIGVTYVDPQNGAVHQVLYPEVSQTTVP